MCTCTLTSQNITADMHLVFYLSANFRSHLKAQQIETVIFGV